MIGNLKFTGVVVLSGIMFSVIGCNSDNDLTKAIGSILVADCNPDNCQESGFCATIPDVQPSLDFGNSPVDAVTQRRLTIKSSNGRTLHITGMSIPEEYERIFNLYAVLIYSDGGMERFDFQDALPFTLDKDDYADVIIRYLPSSAEMSESQLLITSSDTENPEVSIPLRGGGGDLKVCIAEDDDGCSDPRSINFGTTEIASRTTRTVTLENIGTSDITLVGHGLINDSSIDFLLEGPGCVRIAPGEMDHIDVIYNPSDGGTDIGILEIGSMDFDEPEVHIDLLGRAVGAKFCASPSPLELGEVVELTTGTGLVHIWNCGLEMDLDVETITLSGDPSTTYLQFDADPSTPELDQWTTTKTLHPGEGFDVGVQYSPPDPSHKILETMSFTHNGPPFYQASLKVMGQGHPTPRCELAAYPAVFDMGWLVEDELGESCLDVLDCPGFEVVERISAQRTFVLKNKGELPCTNVRLGDITLAEEPAAYNWRFEVVDDLGSTDVDVLEELPVTIKFVTDKPELLPDPVTGDIPSPPIFSAQLKVFSPDQTKIPEPPTGDRFFNVNIKNMAGGDPTCKLEIDVLGNSLLCSGLLGGDLSELNFGAVNLGTQKTLPIALRNIGALPCRVNNISKTGSSDFSIVDASPFDIPILSSASIDITLRPTPEDYSNPFSDLFDYLCTENVVSFDSQSIDEGSLLGDIETHKVGLSGKMTIPSIDVIPGQVEFGKVTLGCCSQVHTVTVYNTGDGALDVSALSTANSPDTLFEVLSPNPSSFQGYTLQPEGSFSVTVKFCPSRDGEHYGILTLTSTDNDNPEFQVPLRGTGTPDGVGDDNYLQPPRPLVDVLFVVDDSGSMQEEQNRMAQNFSSFIETAINLDSDYHLGVIMPEVESEYSGRLLHNCSTRRYIKSTDPVSQQQDDFKCNVRTSDSDRPSSDSKEASLQAARMALDFPNHDPYSTEDYNDGFLRESAKLYLILVTDEEDQSDGPVDLYVDYFKNLKGFGNPDLLNISAITGDVPSGCPVGATEKTASANEYDIDAVDATGGLFQSICSSDWTSMLSQLGLDAFYTREQFALLRPAEPGTLTVYLYGRGDGAECNSCPLEGEFNCNDCCVGRQEINPSSSNGYTFEQSTNSVVFHGDAVPGPNECIQVEYLAICYD